MNISNSKFLFVIAAFCTFGLANAQQEWGTTVFPGPGGSQTTCQDLDKFGSEPIDLEGNAFGVETSKWDKSMPSFLIGIAYKCQKNLLFALSKQHNLTEQNSTLIDRRTQLIIRKIQSISDTNEKLSAQQKREDRALAISAQEQKKQAAQDRQRKLEECEASGPYKLYDAEDSVIQDLDILRGWEENAKQEKRISDAGGVKNLSNVYNNAQGKISAQDALKEAWADYKKLGGKASSPQKVRHTLEDPCAEFRQKQQLP